MKTIQNFKELIEHLADLGQRKKVAVVCAADESTQGAVLKALQAGIIDAVFVGCRQEVEANSAIMEHKDHITIIDADDPDDAAGKAVRLVREGGADVLMKGLINTGRSAQLS